MNVLGLSASPRRDGNSFLLVEAAVEGAREAGHSAELVHVDDHVRHLLRDCRRCRDENGRCTIEDGFESLLRERVVPADAIVFGTPLYWYGVSAAAEGVPRPHLLLHRRVRARRRHVRRGPDGKRLALAIASEESYPGAPLGVIHELQEYARYTHSDLVGVVQGIGNSRRDVLRDPSDPVGRARELGRRIAELRTTDYRLDTERPNTTWPRPDGL